MSKHPQKRQNIQSEFSDVLKQTKLSAVLREIHPMTKDKLDKLTPVHPGEVLLEEFLRPMNLSQNQVALAIRVPARRINEIIQGKRRITADTALRLAYYFNMSAKFWLGLQMDYDLDLAEDALGEQLKVEVCSLQG